MQALILAGGLSRRLGGTPKAGLMLKGQTLLARTVDAAAQFLGSDAAAAPTMLGCTAAGGIRAQAGIAVVGPGAQVARWLETARSAELVTVVQEDPPHSGPAAGIAAGLAALEDRGGHVAVLACDMPHVAGLLPLLLAALAAAPDAAGVMANDAGRAQPLAAIYSARALRDAVEKAGEAHRLQNASVNSLLASVLPMEFAVPPGLAADIDTWEDARAQGIVRGHGDGEGMALGKPR